MENNENFLDYSGLTLYDQLIKEHVQSGMTALENHVEEEFEVLDNAISGETARATMAEGELHDFVVESVSAATEDCAYLGPRDGSATIADFDPQTDTVWNKPQTLSSAQQTQVQTNINVYSKAQTYTKTEVNGLVSTPHQNYVTVSATSGTTAASQVLPTSGQRTNTIYRVSNWNGSVDPVSGYNVTVYSEYAWNESQYVFLRVESQIDEVFDITVYNSNTTYTDLADALGSGGANIPQTLRRGGMSVKFVQTSDNKYVQYRLMSNTFNTTVTNWQSVNADDMPTKDSENLVKSGGVSKITDSIGIVYDNNTLTLQNTQKIYYGNFKAGKKISLKALNVTLEGSGWYNLAVKDLDANDYVIVLYSPTVDAYGEATLPRDCDQLRVEIITEGGRTTCDINYSFEYNLLVESSKNDLSLLNKKQIALSKGIILTSESYYSKIGQILQFHAYSNNPAYKNLMIGVIDKSGNTYGIQMFNNGSIVDDANFTATINGNIAHIKGWLNRGIAYIDAYLDTEAYVQIASSNSGLVVPLQDAALLNEEATSYDSNILSEEGMMNNQGVVGDFSFHHSPNIPLDGVSIIRLTTKMNVAANTYPRIVFFYGDKVVGSYEADTSAVTSTTFKKGVHWQNADSFVVNCYNNSFADFAMTVGKNTLTAIEDILDTFEVHDVDYDISKGSLRDFLNNLPATSKKRYNVHIAKGTYDVSQWLDSTELAGGDSNHVGLTVPDYVTLIGSSPTDCIFTLTFDTASQYVSTINFKNTSGAKNIQFIGTKTRYVCHDDFAKSNPNGYERRLENCIFLGGGGLYYAAAYGCGVKNGARYTVLNCEFIAQEGFLWHTNRDFSIMAELTMINCNCQATNNNNGIIIRSVGSDSAKKLKNRIHLYGCRTNGYSFKEDGGAVYTGLDFIVDGFGNTKNVPITIQSSDSADNNWKPNFRDWFENPTATTLEDFQIGAMKFVNNKPYWWNGTAWVDSNGNSL